MQLKRRKILENSFNLSMFYFVAKSLSWHHLNDLSFLICMNLVFLARIAPVQMTTRSNTVFWRALLESLIPSLEPGGCGTYKVQSEHPSYISIHFIHALNNRL